MPSRVALSCVALEMGKMALSLQDLLELGVVSECKSTCYVADISPSS